MNKTAKIFVSLSIISFFIFNIYANSNIEPKTYSKYVILEDYDTGTILYNKNIDEKLFPASTTKILTAIVAIENGNLNKIVTAKKETLDLLPPYSSNANIKPDEKLTLKELLECLILVSGNDSALVIADEISGNIQDFVNLMNVTAKKIGCTNTNFINPHGYHDDNHYTTARDMMKILRYGMQYDEFRQLLELKEKQIPATNKNDIRNYKSTNRMFFKKDEIGHLAHYYEYNKGGKTGFTNEALRTFVGYAKKDNKTLLVGVFYVKDINHQDGKFIDAENLYNYGFDNFENKALLKQETKLFSTVYENEKRNYYLKSDFTCLLPKGENYRYKYKIELTDLNDNTYINLSQDRSTNEYIIQINSTNLKYNPYIYYEQETLSINYLDKIKSRLIINLYNLKEKIKG